MTITQKVLRQIAPLAIIALFGFSWLCADVSLTILVDNRIPTLSWAYTHSISDFFFIVLTLKTIQWSRCQPPEEQIYIILNTLCAIAAALGLVGMLQAHVFAPLPLKRELWSLDDEWFFGNLVALTSMLMLVLEYWFLRLIQVAPFPSASQPPS